MVDFTRRLDLAQIAVRVIGPALAPILQQLLAVPRAVFAFKAVRTNGTGGQHDMGMVIALIAILAGGMKRHVRNHAPIDKGGLHKGPHQIAPLCVVQLVGQGYRHLTGELGVLAAFHGLDSVPQGRPIFH